jgi:hypothetical protein
METAVGAFGGPLWHDGDAELALMAEVASGKFSTAHPAVSSRGTVPFVAYELCREHLGIHDQLVFCIAHILHPDPFAMLLQDSRRSALQTRLGKLNAVAHPRRP